MGKGEQGERARTAAKKTESAKAQKTRGREMGKNEKEDRVDLRRNKRRSAASEIRGRNVKA